MDTTIADMRNHFSPASKKKDVADEAMVMDRSSPNYYLELIDYYFRNRSEVLAGWKWAEEEYTKGKKVNADTLSLNEVRPGRAYSIVSTTEAMVMANRPNFITKGFTAEDEEERGPIMQRATNHEWRQDFGMIKQTRLCVRDCSRLGLSFMLTSYDSDPLVDYEAERKEAEAAKLEIATDPTSAIAAATLEAEMAAQKVASETPESRTNWEGNDRVLRNRIVSRRVSPWAIIADPLATDEDDWKWIGRVMIADLADVKADDRLKNTENLKPTSTSRLEGRLKEIIDKSNNADQLPYDIVVLYEIFVRKPEGGWVLKLIAEGHDNFLLEADNPYWIGCPYRMLRWNEDGESFFPQSDVQIVGHEIIAERILITKVFDAHIRENSDITFYSDALGLAPEEIHAAQESDVGRMVQFNEPDSSAPLQNRIFKLPKDQKSPEAQNMLLLIERMIQVGAGLSPNQFGQALKSGTSATEAAEVGSYAKGRGANKFSAVEEFISGVAQDRMGLMAQFYDAEDILRLVGVEASKKWATFNWTPGDVQNGLNIIVEPGSTRAMSEESRVNQIVSILSAINQDPAIRTLFDIPALYSELFKRMGFHEGSKFLLSQDGEATAQALAQLEVEKARAGGAGPGGAGGSPQGTPPEIPAAQAGGAAL